MNDTLNLCNDCSIDVEDMGAPPAVIAIVAEVPADECEGCAKPSDVARLIWLEAWAAA